MNQAEFFQANQVDGQVTPAQMMEMMDLPEGDSTSVQSDAPAVAVVPAPEAKVEVSPVDPGATEAEPVILAKDGVHTIPFEKLTEARAAEQAAKALAQAAQEQAADLQKQLDEALKKANTQPPTATATTVATPAQFDPSVFGDYSEESIAKGIAKMQAEQAATIRAELKAEMDAKLAAALEPLQKQHVETAADSHFAAINAKHPDVESVVPSAEFANWMNTQPSVVRAALQTAIEHGTAPQVIEVLDAYKASIGKTELAPAAKPDALAAAAAAVIAKAKSAPPSSLSEIPTGTAAAHNPAEAMLEMSAVGLMTMLEGKTPEQIMALMSKTL